MEGPFTITANQQIDFLRKFYNYQLNVSRRSTDIVKNILVLERGAGYTWSGKTGSGVLSEKEEILWLVGYLEKDKKPYFYALNFKSSDPGKERAARQKITRGIFKELNLIK